MARWDGPKSRAVAVAAAKATVPALGLGGVVFLLWRWSPRTSSFILLVGSFILFSRTYSKPWRLRWSTCLLPGLVAIAGYLVQVLVFDVRTSLGTMAAGVLAGAVLGYLRARGHRLEVERGKVIAHRTALVLVVWLATFLVTQSSALFGSPALVRWGLTGGAFTTSIVVVFSLVLLWRLLSLRRERQIAASTSTRRVPVAGVSALLVVLAVFVSGGAGLAAEPGQVTLEGEWELDRREHDACIVAVPPYFEGWIDLIADFENGLISGSFAGSGSGSYTLPADCAREAPTDYDRSHLETWHAEVPIIEGEFEGTLDPGTGVFEADVAVFVEGEGWREAPGRSYRCWGEDEWTPTCELYYFDRDQEATITGVIDPHGTSSGEFLWWAAYCAAVTPGHIEWNEEKCNSYAEWTADVTDVVWLHNRPPEIAAIGAVPARPDSDDEVVITADASDPDGDELSYSWTLDGVTQPVAAPSVTWRRPPPGDHTVRVSVSDGVDAVEAVLDLRVAEHVGAGDADGDGVVDDEDLCPEEWGLGDDGCPELAVSLGCVPARPWPDDPVTCTASVSGLHPGEEPLYSWYLDGASIQSGPQATWTWGAAADGEHDIAVDLVAEGGAASGEILLEVAGGVVEASEAGFDVSMPVCNGGISSDEVLGCSATLIRTREDIGNLNVTWILGNRVVHTESTGRDTSGWSLDEPPSGRHRVTLIAVDPASNLGRRSSVEVQVRAGATELEEAAAAAALMTGIGLLAAGTGLTTFDSVSSVLERMAPDQVRASISDALDAVSDLVDPRDGSRLQAQGDLVYWDDEVGWIDRSTARTWIADLATQRLERDQQIEATWDRIQRERDQYYREREEALSSEFWRDPVTGDFVHRGVLEEEFDRLHQAHLRDRWHHLQTTYGAYIGSEEVGEFIRQNESNVWRGDRIDPDQLRRLERAADRIFRAESGFRKIKEYTHEQQLVDYVGALSQSTTARIVLALGTAGKSEMLLAPWAMHHRMVERTFQGMSELEVASQAMREWGNESIMMVGGTAVVTLGAPSIGKAMLGGAGEVAERLLPVGWRRAAGGVGQTIYRTATRPIGPDLGELAMRGARRTVHAATGWSDSLRSAAERAMGFAGKVYSFGSQPIEDAIAQIRSSWASSRTGITGAWNRVRDGARLDALRASNAELADAVEDLTKAIDRPGALPMKQAPSLAFTGTQHRHLWDMTDDMFRLTPDEYAAARLLGEMPEAYQQAARQGLIPVRTHQLVNHTRDKILKHAMVRAYRKLPDHVRKGLQRIEITGTGAQPTSVRASTGWTDFDCRSLGSQNAEEAFARAWQREVGRGAPEVGMPGFRIGESPNAYASTDLDAQMFAGLRTTAPDAGFRDENLLRWVDVDGKFSGRAVSPTRSGNLVMGYRADAPLGIVQSSDEAGLWVLEGLPRLRRAAPGTPQFEGVLSDLRRLVEQGNSRHPASSALEWLRVNGKYVTRAAKLGTVGSGQPVEAGIRVIEQMKADRMWRPSPQEMGQAIESSRRWLGMGPGG